MQSDINRSGLFGSTAGLDGRIGMYGRRYYLLSSTFLFVYVLS